MLRYLGRGGEPDGSGHERVEAVGLFASKGGGETAGGPRRCACTCPLALPWAHSRPLPPALLPSRHPSSSHSPILRPSPSCDRTLLPVAGDISKSRGRLSPLVLCSGVVPGNAACVLPASPRGRGDGGPNEREQKASAYIHGTCLLTILSRLLPL